MWIKIVGNNLLHATIPHAKLNIHFNSNLKFKMPIWWDYVFELQPPRGLLSIPKVIYEHGEPWWNYDVDRGKLLTRPPELSSNPTSRVIWQQAGEMSARNEKLAFRCISVHTCKWFLCGVKPYDMGPTALLRLRRKVRCEFWSPIKIHRLGRVWTREPWVQCQGRYQLYYRGKKLTARLTFHRCLISTQTCEFH
jgi:hypothetical protein